MKLTKRLLCLLLVLVTLLSVLPLFTAATETGKEDTKQEETEKPKTATIKVKIVSGSKTLKTYNVTVGDKPVRLTNERYMTYNKKLYELSHYIVEGEKMSYAKIPAYDGTAEWKKTWNNTVSVVYKLHSHKFTPGFTRMYHWDICSCGETTKEVRHVDPATDADKICTCGYVFNDNADLVTLWLENMNLNPRFTKETTEYIGEVVTWKDVTSTSFSVAPFDALAKVKVPENTEIHEGANKFEIVVTSENTLVNKTYTVIAVKPVKVEDTWIGSDGTTVYTDLKTKVARQTASAAISEAVGEKMVELAIADQCSKITLRPEFSKWSIQQTELTVPASLLNAMVEKTQADLVIETPYVSWLTIPHADLAALAAAGETVTITVAKDESFGFTTGEETVEVPAPSDKISLLTPEALEALAQQEEAAAANQTVEAPQ